ncbi:hypothetical protein [Amnibacterium kyonggiense]|nr:hypothetical protein [Amnibacterium kyonggiense]
MSDDAKHLTVNADIRVTDPARLGNPSDERLGEAIAELIRRHAWEAGLEIVDPAAVKVTVGA